MIRQLDWPGLFKRFAESHGWTPEQVLSGVTIPQLWLAFFNARPAAAAKKSGRAAVFEAINRKRAAKGLPPVRVPRWEPGALRKRKRAAARQARRP